jgi:hypothetical protein
MTLASEDEPEKSAIATGHPKSDAEPVCVQCIPVVVDEAPPKEF